jgi:ADP-ribosylglycohydrolase
LAQAVSDLRAALTGCLLGQALGDALGFVVEARPAREAREYVEQCMLAGRAGERSHPGFPFGQYSDDTQLARELLLSFVEAGAWNPDTFARRLAALFEAGGDVGAGPGTRAAALRLGAGAHWTCSGTPAPYAGNGSAMRAAPLGLLLGGDTRAMVEATIEQSLVTHRDPRCSAGALAVAGAARLAAARGPIRTEAFLDALAELTGAADESVTQAIRRLQRWAHLPPDEAARHLRAQGLDPADAGEWRGISAFVTPSVLWSLYAFLRTPDDYWATVCTAVGVGGDTDTMAAIAGAISGARLGPGALPARLVERLDDRGRWGSEALIDLARRAAQLVGS